MKAHAFTSPFCLLLATVVLAAAPAPQGPVEGVWSWNFTMPDGSTIRPQLTLQVTNGVVTGASRFASGTTMPITNAVLNGNRLRFQVIRQREGQTVTTRYDGVLRDGRLTGKIESNWSGDWQSYPWNATHLSRDIEGRWVWGARAVEFKLDGAQLRGRVILEGDAQFPLLSGSYTNGEIVFHIQRERDGQPYINIFQATQQDRLLKGQITRILGADTNVNDWEARRAR